MKHYTESRHFLALRACWYILRGGSVAFRINFTDDGGEALSQPTYYLDCQVNGKPMTPWDITLSHPNPQPDAS